MLRRDPDWRRRYTHLAMRRDKRIAKVAMARKLAVRLYWMMRKEWNYGRVDSAYLLLPVSSWSALEAESYAGFQPRLLKPSVRISRTGLSCVFHIKGYVADSC